MSSVPDPPLLLLLLFQPSLTLLSNQSMSVPTTTGQPACLAAWWPFRTGPAAAAVVEAEVTALDASTAPDAAAKTQSLDDPAAAAVVKTVYPAPPPDAPNASCPPSRPL